MGWTSNKCTDSIICLTQEGEKIDPAKKTKQSLSHSKTQIARVSGDLGLVHAGQDGGGAIGHVAPVPQTSPSAFEPCVPHLGSSRQQEPPESEPSKSASQATGLWVDAAKPEELIRLADSTAGGSKC